MRNDVGNGYEQQKYRKMKLFLMQWLTGRMMCQLQPETVEISEQSTSMQEGQSVCGSKIFSVLQHCDAGVSVWKKPKQCHHQTSTFPVKTVVVNKEAKHQNDAVLEGEMKMTNFKR